MATSVSGMASAASAGVRFEAARMTARKPAVATISMISGADVADALAGRRDPVRHGLLADRDATTRPAATIAPMICDRM